MVDYNRVLKFTHLPLKDRVMARGLSRSYVVINVAIVDDISSVVVCNVADLVDDVLRRV